MSKKTVLILAVIAVLLFSGRSIVRSRVNNADTQAGISNSNAQAGNYIACTICKSSGICHWCDGSGRRANGRQCTSCHGSGKCSNCNGTGAKELIMVNGREYVRCSSCSGSGVCSSCGGTGRGDSISFSGSAYQTNCFTCNGSGTCRFCNGRGYTHF